MTDKEKLLSDLEYACDPRELVDVASAVLDLALRRFKRPKGAKTGVHQCWAQSDERPGYGVDVRGLRGLCVYAAEDSNRDYCLLCGMPEERK